MKDIFKKWWFWLIIVVLILFFTRKYWMPVKHEIKVSDVDWDKRTARIYLKSGDVGGSRDGDVFGNVYSITDSGEKMPTTNGFVFSRVNNPSAGTITVSIYKRAKDDANGNVTLGEKVKETVIDFNNKKVTVIK